MCLWLCVYIIIYIYMYVWVYVCMYSYMDSIEFSSRPWRSRAESGPLTTSRVQWATPKLRQEKTCCVFLMGKTWENYDEPSTFGGSTWMKHQHLRKLWYWWDNDDKPHGFLRDNPLLPGNVSKSSSKFLTPNNYPEYRPVWSKMA